MLFFAISILSAIRRLDAAIAAPPPDAYAAVDDAAADFRHYFLFSLCYA